MNPDQLVIGSILLTDENRPAVLTKILASHPSVTTPQKITWRVGNFQQWGSYGLRFRIGRDVKVSVERSTPTGDFVDQEDIQSGTAHALLDTRTGVLAIAAPKNLSGNADTMAHMLRRVIEAHDEIRSREAIVEINPMRDPADFMLSLLKAAKIDTLSVNISPPNPSHHDKDFTEPLQNITSRTGARQSTLTLKGGHIRAEEVEDAVRTASARGNLVSARIREKPESKPRTINNKKAANTIPATRDQIAREPSGIFEKMLETWHRVRDAVLKRPASRPEGPQDEPDDDTQT